jgi:hypothetical protein
MGVIRFYWLVAREAYRHSLDIAQAVIFVALMLGGVVVAFNPSLKPMIESLDLGGWKIAALVFGSIILIRLLLAPYWLWKAAESRSQTSPERSIDHKVRIQGIADRRDNKKNAVQVIFNFFNSSPFHTAEYEVEEIYVAINGITNEKPNFANMGGMISALSKTSFDFDWIFLNSKLKPGTKGTAGITFKYGIAGKQFTRRGKLVADIHFEKTEVRHYTREETDVPI